MPARECYAMTMSLNLVSLRLDVSTIFMIDDIELPTQGDLVMLGDLDPRDETEKIGKMVAEVVGITIDPDHPEKTIKIGTCISPELGEELINYLKEH